GNDDGGRVDLEFPERVAPAGAARETADADVLGGAGDGDVVDAAVAVGHGLEVGPVGVVVRIDVGTLDDVVAAECGFPSADDATDGGGFAEVDDDPLVVVELAAPTRGGVAVDGEGGGAIFGAMGEGGLVEREVEVLGRERGGAGERGEDR